MRIGMSFIHESYNPWPLRNHSAWSYLADKREWTKPPFAPHNPLTF